MCKCSCKLDGAVLQIKGKQSLAPAHTHCMSKLIGVPIGPFVSLL